MTRFANATREELWLYGRLVERRLSHGEAVAMDRGIVATDARDDALVAAADAELDRLRAHVVTDARVRLLAEADMDGVSGTMVITLHGHSIVTTPESVAADLTLLRSLAVPAADAAGVAPVPSGLPFVWKNGSAAVLLHESLGHPREHGIADVPLPPWLRVDIPLVPRRASFRDLPLLRMRHVVAHQEHAPFALPERRIDIHLLDGGAYDPLTDIVTLRIAAAMLVAGAREERLVPFEIVQPRRALSLAGAVGEPLRYPGVICSREGQELVVPSFAPVMVTR